MATLALLLAVSTGVSGMPPPIPPLTESDISQIVGAVLSHVYFAQYLHPEIPERLPLKITIAAPWSGARPGLVLYRQPVVVVEDATNAINFAITQTANGAKAEVFYRLADRYGQAERGRSRGLVAPCAGPHR